MKLTAAGILIAFASCLWAGVASAQITVEPQALRIVPKQSVTVPARRMLIYELGTYDSGEAVGAEVHVENAYYKDLSAYVVDATNMALARQNLAFKSLAGVTKRKAPFRLMARINALGPYYLVLDNRYANFISKKVIYQVAGIKHLSQQQVEAIRAPLTRAYADLKRTFVFKDFNIHIRHCGQVNAFSTTATGDITLCTEIFQDLAAQPGAMTAVFFHELGHTLLNLWGYPDYQNEDVADEFAVTMMLRFGGEQGKQAISEWMDWFAKRNSRAEAANMLVNGDTHSLSVQRIRNIQRYVTNSSDLMRRWDTILYPHMTRRALAAVVSHPASYDDVGAAKRALAMRQSAQ